MYKKIYLTTLGTTLHNKAKNTIASPAMNTSMLPKEMNPKTETKEIKYHTIEKETNKRTYVPNNGMNVYRLKQIIIYITNVHLRYN